MIQQLKLLHNVPHVGKTSFGIGQISVSLAKAQLSLGHDVDIWCMDLEENVDWAIEAHHFPREHFKRFATFGPHKLWFSPGILKYAAKDNGHYDIVHQHGIWTGNSIATYHFAKKNKALTVIAPHGSLNSWALGLSPWKKKASLKLYERKNLKMASCLHATSEIEISDFRDFGLKNPIAYIENGIREQALLVRGNGNRFRIQHEIPRDMRIILFLSRISPKKGLGMLIEAIASMKNSFHPWLLIIAGVDEFNHKNEIELLIKRHGLEANIKLIGPMFNESKDDAFNAAELFILPSLSEGSPMVILDSLAAGVPVITTKASSWNDLNEFKCGWWTEIDLDAVAKALREATSMSSEDLHQMGEHGRNLVLSKYTWSRLSKKTILLYNWLLGMGGKPDFVVTN